jgi:RimJ/RimL family protein N-acetyltransferase
VEKLETVIRDIFTTDGEYYISPILECDRDNYTELHRQINGEGSLYLNPVSKDMMWEQTLDGEDRVYSIFNKDDIYCGSLELQNPKSNTPELGINLLETMRKKGIAKRTIAMFAKHVYEIQEMDYFIIRISSNNPHSRHVFEKMGAELIGKEEGSFKKFLKQYGNLVGGVEKGEELFKQFFDEDSENEVIYRYKLLPEIFLKPV